MIKKHGPPAPTTRYVLLMLATYMRCDGSHCFPSAETLADDTCLSDRAVRNHLKEAIHTGWITRKAQGAAGGQAWRRSIYTPLIPENVRQEVPDLPKRAEGGAARSGEGAEPDDQKVRQEVPPNKEGNKETERASRARGQTSTRKQGVPSPAIPYTPEFEELWAVHRRGGKLAAFKAYQKAVPHKVEHAVAMSRLKAYVKRTVSDRFQGANLSTWLNQEYWEQEAPPLDSASAAGRPVREGSAARWVS